MNLNANNPTALLFTLVITLFSQPSFSVTYECPKQAPPAYTGDLNVSSKYNPNDPTRSTEIAVDSESLAIQHHLNKFSAGIVSFSDYYVHYRDDRRGDLALDCLHNWLSNWASESAITTDSPTATGQALRSWTLSSISSSLLKVKHFAGDKWSLTEIEKNWVNQLAKHVSQDFSGRIETLPDRINNHDYWAAWAVTATSVMTKNRDLSDWGYVVFKHAINQAAYDERTRTSYLPNEIGRGSLGVHYTQFAITPLIMLSEYLPQLGYSVNAQDQQTLSGLANFAALSILKPEYLRHLTSYAQRTPSTGILSWSIPFRFYNPTHSLVNKLLNTYGDSVKGHHQIGGNIRPLYPIDPA